MIHQASQLQRKAARRRRAGLAALFLLFVMFAAILSNALAATAEHRRAEQLHVHTLDVLLVNGELETAINGAMRGERGYLLTGEREFLDAYFAGERGSTQLIARLRRLTADNAAQQRNLTMLEGRTKPYFAALASLIALEEQGHHERAVQAIRDHFDRRQIIAVLAALHQIDAEERRLLDLRRVASEQADQRVESYNYIVAAASLVFMALLTGAIVSASRAHRRALELAAELHDLATTDALTGLPNRRQLMSALDTEVQRAARSGRPLSVALLDVDRFKAINDLHGHPAGDEVLRAIADELRMLTRAGDIVARFGGEEFAVLMPETSLAQGKRACERLRIGIEKRKIDLPDGVTVGVTISSGVALLAGGEAIARLFARADAALYKAKSDGRNLVRLAA